MSEAIMGIQAIFGQLETIMNKAFERKDLIEDNIVQLDRVKRKFHDIQEQYPHAASVVVNSMHAAASLREMKIAIQIEFERVVSQQEKILSAKRTDRVKRMRRILNECEMLEDNFLKFLGEKVFPILPSSSCSEWYSPISNVPPNPPRLTLDYSNAFTDEGKLKQEILGQKGRRIIALIVSGQGGTGKTCAIRGLADDKDIQRRFTGGLLYIQLGNDAKIVDIIKGLAKVVYQTGGKQLSQEIKSLENFRDACDMASSWFFSQTCLFLIDDIWRVNGIDAETIDILGRIVHNNSGMVYTSRDKYFCSKAERTINFQAKKPDGKIARAMLLEHSNISKEDLASFSTKNLFSFYAVLNECQGLPLTLGIAGGTVLTWSWKYSRNNQQNVWSDYWSEMKKCSSIYAFTKSSMDESNRLHDIVGISLDVLNRMDEKCEYPFLFRALSLFRKQHSVPMAALQKIWDLKSLEETKMKIEAFYNVSLVQIIKEENAFIQLHDLVLDIAKYEASTHDEAQIFYNRLINNYSEATDNIPHGEVCEPLVEDADNTFEDSCYGEWKICTKWWDIPADGYIHDSVCHLLRCGGKIEELLWLLSQPNWIVFRLLNGGVLQVVADLNEGISALGRVTSSAEQWEHIEIIGKATRLSSSFVHENPGEVWFQLYGRLQGHAKTNNWTARFMRNIESAASRPWVKAPIGILQQASLYSHSFFKSKGWILGIHFKKDHAIFLWKSSAESFVVTSKNIITEDKNSLELDSASFMHTGSIRYDYWAAFTADGLNVILVDGTLLVRIFKTDTGELKTLYRLKPHLKITGRKLFGRRLSSRLKSQAANHQGDYFIALSKNGMYMATSNEIHDVQIWNTISGYAVGPPLRGHTERVMSMAMNSDKTRLVTGSSDKTIIVWDAKSGKAIGSPLYGHTDAVTCLAMSLDSKTVVSGARDTSVRIWDITSGGSSRDPLLGHTSSIQCVSVSQDGSKVVSGSLDKTVIVWDLKNYPIEGVPLHGHTGWIDYVEINENGGIVISGSRDNTVRVWNTSRIKKVERRDSENRSEYRSGVMSVDGRGYLWKTEEYTGKILDTKSGEALGLVRHIDIKSVQCMAKSADNRSCGFGMMDGCVVFWDVLSTQPIGKPLRAHTGAISCVAMSEDGRLLISGSSDSTLRAWGTALRKTVGKPFFGHTDPVSCVALSRDGKKLVSGSFDNNVLVWDIRKTKNSTVTFIGHTDWIQCVGINADGTKVVSGSADGTVRLWNVSSCQQVGGPFYHDGGILCLGVDEKISKVATICFNGLQKLWDTDSRLGVMYTLGKPWNSEMNNLSIRWQGRFHLVKRRKIVDVDEDGHQQVLATTQLELFNVPGRDVYFSNYTDPLYIVR